MGSPCLQQKQVITARLARGRQRVVTSVITFFFGDEALLDLVKAERHGSPSPQAALDPEGACR